MQNFVSTAIGLLFFMFFARIVTQNEMGIYGAVYLVYMISSIFGALGLRVAGSRFFSYLYGENKRERITETASRIIVIALISSLAIASIQFIFHESLSNLILGDTTYAYLFRIGSIAVFATVIASVLMGFMQGFQHFGRLALFRLSSQTIRVTVTIILLILGLGVASVFIGLIVLYTIFSILASMTVVNALSELTNTSKKDEKGSISFEKLLKFSIPFMVFELIFYISDSIDRLVVLNILGIKPLGIYTVALTGSASILLILIMPLQSTLIPAMSEVYAKGGSNSVSTILKLSSRYISIVLIPACLGLAVLSPSVITILAGASYLEAAIPFSIISIGLVMHGFSIALISAMTALEKTHRIALAVLLASISELPLTFVLVQYFGLLGAAVGKSILYTSIFILLIFFSIKIFQVKFDKKIIVKSVLASTVMTIILITAGSLNSYSLSLVPLYVLSGVVIYTVVMSLLGGIRKDDILLLSEILPGGKKLLHKMNEVINSYRILSKICKYLLRS